MDIEIATTRYSMCFNFYSILREADAQGLAEVIVMQPIGIGVAYVMRDRFARAAYGC
jgi:hypothetical protein